VSQEMRARIFHPTKVIAILLALTLVFTMLLTMGASAEDEDIITLTVGNVSGTVGQSLQVIVSISGVEDSAQVEKISGGQFEMVYEPDVADCMSETWIARGSLISDGDEFIVARNPKSQPDTLSVAWAGQAQNPNLPGYDPEYGFHKDGQLFRITFYFNKAGIVNLEMKNLILVDENGTNIPSASLNIINGTITVMATVPNIVNMTAADAEAAIIAAGLTVGNVTEES
jgi:hypothetical protein